MVHLGAAPTCVRRPPIILCGEAFRSVRDEKSKAFAVIRCDDRRSSSACEVRRSQNTQLRSLAAALSDLHHPSQTAPLGENPTCAAPRRS